jgi:hypothetical protein
MNYMIEKKILKSSKNTHMKLFLILVTNYIIYLYTTNYTTIIYYFRHYSAIP